MLQAKRKHHRKCYFSYYPFTIEELQTQFTTPKVPSKARSGPTNGRALKVKFVKDNECVYSYGNMKNVLQDNNISDTFTLCNGILINKQGWQKIYE